MRMRRYVFSMFLLVALVVGALALTTPAPQAAPKCVDPNLCPDIICAPGTVFVPTTCKECGHCEPINCGRGKRPCENSL